MMTKALAKALAPMITVNSVAPGVIDFDHGDQDVDTDTRAMINATPMRRPGRPEEIAEAVHFFLTAPDFITGQVVAVDGGLSQR
jgi:3-oxoacyl-[acyl-carrier protein] reductase/pteridine reductase